jgi:hypothetical protein
VFRRLILTVVVIAASVSCRRPAEPPAASLIERTHQTMGTELRVTVSTGDSARADTARVGEGLMAASRRAMKDIDISG